ncbi:hypothetical protein ACFQPF_12885 [Fictibacillus iocasae]|uniref:Uncharacterized protein n=1 Tax=Fictibacillus iocasae TaxID=2715437 RepID=A0ABW2NSN4_9BACL
MFIAQIFFTLFGFFGYYAWFVYYFGIFYENLNNHAPIKIATFMLLMLYSFLTYTRFFLGYYQDLTDFDTGYPGYILTILFLYLSREWNKIIGVIFSLIIVLMTIYYVFTPSSNSEELHYQMFNLTIPNTIMLLLNIILLFTADTLVKPRKEQLNK